MIDLSGWLARITQLHPKRIALGLERVQTVAARLEVCHWDIPVVTVTGTNGKGSSVALLEALWVDAGYSVASFTSPFLLRYNEQFRLQEKPVSDELLCRAFAAIEAHRGDIELTYFECGVIAALWMFKQSKLDVLILEVGLGGRLDATNIIDADITLITTVDLDHVELLGPDKESIGREKAGLFRAGKQAVCGDVSPPESVLSYAKAIGTELFLAGKDFGFEAYVDHWDFWSQKGGPKNMPLPTVHLPNAAAVLQVIELLSAKLPVPLHAYQSALARVQLPGRFSKLDLPVEAYADVAHNPQAISLLAQRLRANSADKACTRLVFGMLADKDIAQCVSLMQMPNTSWYLASPESERAATGEQLATIFTNLALENWKLYATPWDAFQQALADAKTNDRVVIFGSFYLVAAVLQKLAVAA